MTEAEDARLRSVARRIDRLGVAAHVHRFADDFKRKLAESSVVVAMAGYNTVCDVLSYRRPSILVPRPGPSQEQPMRASILGSRGLAAHLPLAECTGRAMAGALRPLFDPQPYPGDAVPELGGVDRAVRSLLDLVGA